MNDESLSALTEVLERFSDLVQPTVVATSPSQDLIARLSSGGYEPAPARLIANLRLEATHPDDTIIDHWQIREVATHQDALLFADLLDAGYAATDGVRSLIRAEHARPEVGAFIAFHDNQPPAAAAMSLHGTVCTRRSGDTRSRWVPAELESRFEEFVAEIGRIPLVREPLVLRGSGDGARSGNHRFEVDVIAVPATPIARATAAIPAMPRQTFLTCLRTRTSSRISVRKPPEPDAGASKRFACISGFSPVGFVVCVGRVVGTYRSELSV